jgi:hypothetical protein
MAMAEIGTVTGLIVDGQDTKKAGPRNELTGAGDVPTIMFTH